MLSTTTQKQINDEWQRKADADGNDVSGSDAETFDWQPKYPAVPTTDVRHDALRYALDAVARKAVPFFDTAYAYYSDLLWDANNAADMNTDDVAFIVVRSMGTSWFTPLYQDSEHIDAKFAEAKGQAEAFKLRDYPAAVLRIERIHASGFDVRVAYTTS